MDLLPGARSRPPLLWVLAVAPGWAQPAEMKGSSGAWPPLASPLLCPVSPIPAGHRVPALGLSWGGRCLRSIGQRDGVSGAMRCHAPGLGKCFPAVWVCWPTPARSSSPGRAPHRAKGILEQQQQQKSAVTAAAENHRLHSLGLPPPCFPPPGGVSHFKRGQK